VLTPKGRRKLNEARKTHLASVRALFSERFDKEELESLASLLERLPQREIPCE
jgi:DNA-binding MarR family transcriptional regulator